MNINENQELLSGLNVDSARETTLGGNQWLDDVHRLKWQSETNEVIKNDEESSFAPSKSDGKLIVRLEAMQIRTFIV